MKAKRILMVSGALLLLAAGSLYATGLVGLYQLGQEVDTIAANDARVGGPWPRATDSCIGCHGQDGNARAQNYPSLAGQPRAYLEKQLQAFGSGARSDSIMTPLALSMSEPEMAAFAAHFAKMKPASNATFKADPASVARGEALARGSNCIACHGAKLEGKDLSPRLAGQGYGYLRDQLTRFKHGQRSDPTGAMAVITAPLTQQHIEDLAQYLASR